MSVNTASLKRLSRELMVLADSIDNGPEVSDFDRVGQFHEKFGLANVTHHQPCAAHEIMRELVEFRLKFLLEELLEIAEGYGYELEENEFSTERPFQFARKHLMPGDAAPRQDLPKIFDGLIDLVYVALGTAHLHHFPWAEGFAEVQRANMQKVRAQRAADSTRGSTFDVIKPAGWTPPNIIEVLMRKGWKGPQLLEK